MCVVVCHCGYVFECACMVVCWCSVCYTGGTLCRLDMDAPCVVSFCCQIGLLTRFVVGYVRVCVVVRL